MAKINKDWLDIYFSYGVDAKNRYIFLTQDIDADSVSHVIKGMYLMESEDSTKPIELRVMSYGGDVYHMFALHDATKTLKSPIHTIGLGSVMSAAVLLVACGEKGQRWAGENTTFMIHVPSWHKDYTAQHHHRIEVEESERLWKRWYELMGRYTKKDAKFWEKLCDKKVDIYFDSDQALEWGVIDQIWSEKEGEASE
jgi:ATP-dependent Clp protease protease subunit